MCGHSRILGLPAHPWALQVAVVQSVLGDSEHLDAFPNIGLHH